MKVNAKGQVTIPVEIRDGRHWTEERVVSDSEIGPGRCRFELAPIPGQRLDLDASQPFLMSLPVSPLVLPLLVHPAIYKHAGILAL